MGSGVDYAATFGAGLWPRRTRLHLGPAADNRLSRAAELDLTKSSAPAHRPANPAVSGGVHCCHWKAAAAADAWQMGQAMACRLAMQSRRTTQTCWLSEPIRSATARTHSTGAEAVYRFGSCSAEATPNCSDRPDKFGSTVTDKHRTQAAWNPPPSEDPHRPRSRWHNGAEPWYPRDRET